MLLSTVVVLKRCWLIAILLPVKFHLANSVASETSSVLATALDRGFLAWILLAAVA